jgi:hypothetical protein
MHLSIIVVFNSRGLDIPTVDLVLNSELPRNPTNYVSLLSGYAPCCRWHFLLDRRNPHLAVHLLNLRKTFLRFIGLVVQLVQVGVD